MPAKIVVDTSVIIKAFSTGQNAENEGWELLEQFHTRNTRASSCISLCIDPGKSKIMNDYENAINILSLRRPEAIGEFEFWERKLKARRKAFDADDGNIEVALGGLLGELEEEFGYKRGLSDSTELLFISRAAWEKDYNKRIIVYDDKCEIEGYRRRFLNDNRLKKYLEDQFAIKFLSIDAAKTFLKMQLDREATGESYQKPPQVRLKDLIERHFQTSDLVTICFELEIDHENVLAETKSLSALFLVRDCMRRGITNRLILICSMMRPDIEWSNE